MKNKVFAGYACVKKKITSKTL